MDKKVRLPHDICFTVCLMSDWWNPCFVLTVQLWSVRDRHFVYLAHCAATDASGQHRQY